MRRTLFLLEDAEQAGWKGYAVSLALSGAAFVLRWALDPILGDVQPFAFFYLSVAFTAWLAGTRPAVLATALGLCAGWFLFVQPQNTFHPANLVRLLTYLLVCACFLLVVRSSRRSRDAAEEGARIVRRAEEDIRKQNALLVGLAETLLDGILIVSTEGRILYANSQFKQVWHLPPEVIASGSDEAALQAAAEQTANPQRFLESVHRAYQRPDQVVRDELVMADGRVYDRFGAPVLHQGQHYGWVWSFRDITGQKRAADETDRQRALLEAVLDACPVGVIVADAQGKILRMNPANQRLWGNAPLSENVEQYRVWKGWWADGSARTGQLLAPHEWALARALRGEVSPGDIVEIEPFDSLGIRRTMINSGAPVRDRHGKIIGGVVAQMDITDRRRAQQELAKAKSELERYAANLEKLVAERTARLTETVHELESFSYSLSHDMRAPLRAMKSFSQILEAEYGPQLGQDGNGLLQRIATAASRLDQLIQDVLMYSRVVREQVKLKPVCIEKLTRQLIDENPALQEPRATVEIQKPLLPVLGHEAYLTQVLSNLLYNAVKFMPPGRHPQVRVWTEPKNGHVRLAVQDNGIGIEPEAQSRIFGMFQRLHTDKEYEGTGIGLAIVRKAVERMGGRLGVDSDPGHGSTFWVELGGAASALNDHPAPAP